MIPLFGFGQGRLMVNGDEHDQLFTQLQFLYNNTNLLNEACAHSVLTSDLIQVCRKAFDDNAWLETGRHESCVYFACHLLGTLALSSESASIKVGNEAYCAQILYDLWTCADFETGECPNWFEARAASRTIAAIAAKCVTSGNVTFLNKLNQLARKISYTQNDNIVKIALHQYTTCIDDVLKRFSIVPYTVSRYVVELAIQILEPSKDISTAKADWFWPKLNGFAQEWKQFNGGILVSLAAVATKTSNEDLLTSFMECDIKKIEDACLLDLAHIFDATQSEGTTTDHGRYGTLGWESMTDALIDLTQYQPFASKLTQSDVIIEALILRLRDRTTLHKRYDVIIYNLLKHEVIQKDKPFLLYDLAETLTMLLEADWKSHSWAETQTGECEKYLFDTIVDCLKLIFHVPVFDFVSDASGNTTVPKKFLCRLCKKLMHVPCNISCCNHIYCNFCCVQKLTIDNGRAQCAVKKCQKSFKFSSSEVKYNSKIANSVAKCKYGVRLEGVAGDTHSFTGILRDCWEFVSNHAVLNSETDLSQVFDYFCKFMIRHTTGYSNQEMQGARNEARSMKEKGNEHFKKKEYLKAIEYYRQGLQACPHLHTSDRMTLHSNLSICFAKLGDELNSYKSALMGLAHDQNHLKLNNSLSKCYQQLTVKHVVTDKFWNFGTGRKKQDQEKEHYLSEVHEMVVADFHAIFGYSYYCVHGKAGPSLGYQHQDDLARSDAYYQEISKMHSEKHQCRNYVQNRFRSYLVQYQEFLLNRMRAKRYVYHWLLSELATKRIFCIGLTDEEIQSKEWTLVSDILKAARRTFSLRYCLWRLPESDRNVLVCGYNRIHSKSGQNGFINHIPSDITQLIRKYVFTRQQFDIYDVSAEDIVRMAEKSTYLIKSEKRLKNENEWDGYFGIKLANAQESFDPNWRDVKFPLDKDDDVILRFSDAVTYIPPAPLPVNI